MPYLRKETLLRETFRRQNLLLLVRNEGTTRRDEITQLQRSAGSRRQLQLRRQLQPRRLLQRRQETQRQGPARQLRAHEHRRLQGNRCRHPLHPLPHLPLQRPRGRGTVHRALPPRQRCPAQPQGETHAPAAAHPLAPGHGAELHPGNEPLARCHPKGGRDVRLHHAARQRRQERGPQGRGGSARHRILQPSVRKNHQRQVPQRAAEPRHRRMEQGIHPDFAHQALRPIRHRQHQRPAPRRRNHPTDHHHRGRKRPPHPDELRIPLRAERGQRRRHQHRREPRGL